MRLELTDTNVKRTFLVCVSIYIRQRYTSSVVNKYIFHGRMFGFLKNFYNFHVSAGNTEIF